MSIYPYEYTQFDELEIEGLGYYIHYQSILSNTWIIDHNLESKNLLFTVYDQNDVYQSVAPIFVNENRIILNLTEKIKGRAIIIVPGFSVGSNNNNDTIIEQIKTKNWRVFV